MCGIAGFSLNPAEQHDLGINSRSLACQLLLDIEHRGRDASGASWFDAKGRNHVQKAPDSARSFVNDLSMWSQAKYAILHTRAATQGHPMVNANNHPVRASNIIGVHNGCVYNDNSIFNTIGLDHRMAEVDTEAIFAALAYGRGSLVGADVPDVTVLEQVQGSAAVAYFDLDDIRDDGQVLHLARLNTSPLHIFQTKGGSVVFSSLEETVLTMEFFNFDVCWEYEAGEGEYFVVRDGTIAEASQFTPARYTYTSKYSDWEYASTNASWKQGKGTKDDYEWHDIADRPYETKVVNGVTHVRFKDDPADEFTADDEELSLLEEMATVTAPDVDVSVYNTGDLESYYLNKDAKFSYDVERWYHREYGAREEAIADYMAPKHRDFRDYFDCHGDLRPGDWVETEVLGCPVYGQVVQMPRTFPHGAYILRVALPVTGTGDYEYAFVERGQDGFLQVERDLAKEGPSHLEVKV